MGILPFLDDMDDNGGAAFGNSEDVKHELEQYGNSNKAKIMLRFFKTGKGQYGEGDVFIGVKVPEQRAVAIY